MDRYNSSLCPPQSVWGRMGSKNSKGGRDSTDTADPNLRPNDGSLRATYLATKRTCAKAEAPTAPSRLLQRSLSDPWESEGLLYGQDFNKLKSLQLQKRTLFIDPTFPSSMASITYSGSMVYKLPNVVWKRPGEIFKRPQLVIKGANKNDVNQGQLGDCWLLCALAGLAESDVSVFEGSCPSIR